VKFKARLGDEEKEIEVIKQGDRLLVTFDGRTYEARLVHLDGPAFVLEVEEPTGQDGRLRRRQIRAAGLRDGDRRQLWANGRLVRYERVREGAAGHGAAAGASLSASIPAVVSEILVEVGAEVKTGQKLILLESMKMVLPIQAPYNGTVRAINCQTGEAVQPGKQLIELENQE
jgi:biotin carboxyl carrier protein